MSEKYSLLPDFDETIFIDTSASVSIQETKWQHPERQAIATEILKGMVSSGLMESPQEMAKEAVELTDALLAELNK